MEKNTLEPRDLLLSAAEDLIKEKKSDRRWKNIRFFLGLIVFILLACMLFAQSTQPSLVDGTGDGYVAVIRLEGMIAPGESFSAATVLPILQNAFEDKDAKGILLDINSGGGTPVQASIIHDAIIDLKKRYHKKVIVVGEDMLASGAYFVAVAADKIYVNPNSITGSVGVIMKGFGFADLIKKMGVERRVYTSGIAKDRLDPFLPQTPEDVQKIQQVINEIHDNFKSAVMAGRQGKLTDAPDQLFTGDFWSGSAAVKLGLIDGLGNLTDTMAKEFGTTTYKDYSESGSFLKSLVGQMGSSLNLFLSELPEKMLDAVNRKAYS